MNARFFAVAVVASLLAVGCEKNKPKGPSVEELERQAEEKERQAKKEREETLAKDRADRDKLLPLIEEKRRALEKPYAAIYANLPDPQKLKQRQECPDAKISADTPDPAKRNVVVFNQESVYRIAGRTGGAAYHTVAAEDGLYMLRPDAKETRVVERKTPETADQAKQEVEALDWVADHRYVGVAVFSGFRPARVSGNGSTPAHVDGWTVIFDKEGAKMLCWVEASGENLPSKAETLTVGRSIDEDLWSMYLVTTGRNLDAISKVLAIEGAPRKK